MSIIFQDYFEGNAYLDTLPLVLKKKFKCHILKSVYFIVEREIFHPLTHSPNVHNGQVWDRSKPGTRNSVQVPHMGDRDSTT